MYTQLGKKFRTGLCVLVVFIQAGCSQDITLGTVSMTDGLPAVTIPGAAIPGDLGLSIDLAIDSSIIGVEADSQFLTFARIRNLRLTILDRSDTDSLEDGQLDSFAFLGGLTVAIRAQIDGVEQEEVVAFLSENDPQIGTTTRSLDLSVVDIDVLDYLQARRGYQLALSFSGNIPPDAVTLSGDVRYRVGVGL